MPWPSGSWRLEIAAIVEEIHYLSRWFQAQSAVPNSQELGDAVDAHLNSVQYYLSRRLGANPTSIQGHLEAAKAHLLRLAPLSYVRSCLPSIVVQARRTLDANDLQLIRLQDFAKKAESTELTEDERQTIVACQRGASE
jgi:hypothetical protein